MNRYLVSAYALHEGEKLLTIERQPLRDYQVKETSLILPHERFFTLTIDSQGLISTKQGSSNLIVMREDLTVRTLIILDDPSTPGVLLDYLHKHFMPDFRKAFELSLHSGLSIDRIETRAIASEEFKSMCEEEGTIREIFLINKRDFMDIKRVSSVTLDGKEFKIQSRDGLPEIMLRHLMHLIN